MFGAGIPLGRYFGINVRVDWTFLIYAYYSLQRFQDPYFGLAVLVGLFGCVLLHEFGHALAARWADGEAEDILLWPFGGLAFCRPAWHPTAHLITTVAGPLVTLVLTVLFYGLYVNLDPWLGNWSPFTLEVIGIMYALNWRLLLFNLIPAFPMDGGRILRDSLWHFMSAETATRIAVWVSRSVAALTVLFVLAPRQFWSSELGLALPAFVRFLGLYCSGNWWLLFLVVLMFLQGMSEEQIVAAEATGTYNFSLRERLKRGSRKRAFKSAVNAQRQTAASEGFHRCGVCARTERDDPHLDFRVCTDCADGSEYCPEHIDAHSHR